MSSGSPGFRGARTATKGDGGSLTDQAKDVAATLLEARERVAVRLLGHYDQVIEPVRQALKAQAFKRNRHVVEIALIAAGAAQEQGEAEAGDSVLAACADLTLGKARA